MDETWRTWRKVPSVIGAFASLKEHAEKAYEQVDETTFSTFSVGGIVNIRSVHERRITPEEASLVLSAVSAIDREMADRLAVLRFHLYQAEGTREHLISAWRGVVADSFGKDIPEWRVQGYFRRREDSVLRRRLRTGRAFLDAWVDKLEALRRAANRALEATSL